MQQPIKRKTRKQKVADYEQTLKASKSKINWVSGALTALFIGAIILTVFEIEIYRKTLINWVLPTFIWVSIGLILTPLTSSFLKKYYDTDSFFLRLIFNIVIWGGLVIYSFMATNYYFPRDNSKIIKTKIIKTGHLAKGRYGCGEPYCDVVIDKKEKQLTFPCDFEIEKYNFIELTIKKGLWGFDIIIDKRPTYENNNAL